MKNHATTYLLAGSILLGEVHTFWERSCYSVHNWILARYVPLTTQDNVKYLTDELLPIIYFGAWLLFKRNAVNETTVKVFFLFAILDLIAYWYNWKTYGYFIIYFILIAAWIVLYMKRK